MLIPLTSRVISWKPILMPVFCPINSSLEIEKLDLVTENAPHSYKKTKTKKNRLLWWRAVTRKKTSQKEILSFKFMIKSNQTHTHLHAHREKSSKIELEDLPYQYAKKGRRTGGPWACVKRIDLGKEREREFSFLFTRTRTKSFIL